MVLHADGDAQRDAKEEEEGSFESFVYFVMELLPPKKTDDWKREKKTRTSKTAKEASVRLFYQ